MDFAIRQREVRRRSVLPTSERAPCVPKFTHEGSRSDEYQKTVGAVSLGVVLLGATAACSSNSSSDASSATWKLGVEAPLTGDQSTLGLGMLQGAELAADQINTAGGVLGRKIEIIKIDDAANAATGVAAANAAIAAGLNGVVGPKPVVGTQTLPLYLKAGVVPDSFDIGQLH